MELRIISYSRTIIWLQLARISVYNNNLVIRNRAVTKRSTRKCSVSYNEQSVGPRTTASQRISAILSINIFQIKSELLFLAWHASASLSPRSVRSGAIISLINFSFGLRLGLLWAAFNNYFVDQIRHTIVTRSKISRVTMCIEFRFSWLKSFFCEMGLLQS